VCDRELGRQLLVQVDAQARLLVGPVVAVFQFGTAAERVLFGFMMFLLEKTKAVSELETAYGIWSISSPENQSLPWTSRMLFLIRSCVKPETEFSAFLYQNTARAFSCWRAMPCSGSAISHHLSPTLTCASPLVGFSKSILALGAHFSSPLFSSMGKPLSHCPLTVQTNFPQVRLASLSSGLVSNVSRAPFASSNSFWISWTLLFSAVTLVSSSLRTSVSFTLLRVSSAKVSKVLAASYLSASTHWRINCSESFVTSSFT